MKPVLCISHQPSVTPGIVADVFEDIGIAYEPLRAWLEPDWPQPQAISGLIMLGGEMNVDDSAHYPWLEPARDYMKEAVGLGLPVLGICLGAQMLARTLNAKVYRASEREIGFLPVEATFACKVDPVLGAFARLEHVFQWHEDAFSLPEGATLMLTGERVHNQAFRYGERAFGVQFHFEVTVDIIDSWCDETPLLEQRWGTTKDRLLQQAAAHLPGQMAADRQRIRAFADMTA